MPTNQYNTQARQQVSSQPKWYQYISPYIEGASKTMENVNKRKEAYMKAFKAYMAEAAEQAKNYATNAKKQIEYYTPIVKNKAKEYVREGVDSAKEYVQEKANNVKNTVSTIVNTGVDSVKRSWNNETLPDVATDYGGVYTPGEPFITELKDARYKWGHVKPMKALGLSPMPYTMTNRDFSESVKSCMDSILERELTKKDPLWREKTAKGDTVTVLIPGSSYVNNYGGSNKGMNYRLFSPLGQVEHTFGSWTGRATKNEFIHEDDYDFKDIKMKDLGPWYSSGDAFYNKFRSDVVPILNTLDTVPENEKPKIRIVRRRKPWR